MSMDSQELATKHQQIIRYISELSVGTRISVRKIAQTLEVSEGTAYRAIKEAENQGLVSTKERTGTVRVEKKHRQNIDKLTFSEVVEIVEGEVLGGAGGLEKTLNKFVIGAMQLEAMMRYIDPGSLLIVGNRNKAHLNAIQQGSGVLITGGFKTTSEVTELADKLDLPIISCKYDTFTVATMINRAIYDRVIKKKIMLVGDIIRSDIPVHTLKTASTVQGMLKLIEETGHDRFPVVDDWNRPIGMITRRDVTDAAPTQTVEKCMTRNPFTISPQTSIASAAHMMVWEGIELLPVVDTNRQMLGVISRKDVLNALQYVQTQSHNGETFEDLIWSGFQDLRNEEGKLYFQGTITAQMTNHLGTVSEGVLTTLMTQVAYRTFKENNKGDLILDNFSGYFLKPVQMDSVIDIIPTVIEESRRFCKIDMDIYLAGSLVAKAMLTARVIDKS